MPIPETYDLTCDNPRGDESVVEGADNAWEIPFATAVATDFSSCAKRCEFREGFRSDFPDAMAEATAEIVSDTMTEHRLFVFLPNSAVFTVRQGRWDAEAYTTDPVTGEDELVYRVKMGAWALNQEVTGP